MRRRDKREAQTLTLSQPNTGIACTIDIGEAASVHPVNKQEVGRRLALIANKLVYKQDCIASGSILSIQVKGFQQMMERIDRFCHCR